MSGISDDLVETRTDILLVGITRKDDLHPVKANVMARDYEIGILKSELEATERRVESEKKAALQASAEAAAISADAADKAERVRLEMEGKVAVAEAALAAAKEVAEAKGAEVMRGGNGGGRGGRKSDVVDTRDVGSQASQGSQVSPGQEQRNCDSNVAYCLPPTTYHPPPTIYHLRVASCSWITPQAEEEESVTRNTHGKKGKKNAHAATNTRKA